MPSGDNTIAEYKLEGGFPETRFVRREDLVDKPITDNGNFWYNPVDISAENYLPPRVTLTSEQLRKSGYKTVPGTVPLYVKLFLTGQ